ncbi:YifB family Mg chelatase-like AAA ATPase [candidate division WOR-3 bacterium]|nr:YifB family Mg chelatase-like AAA ATPase [candidate division WOR-3 bacterium]
MVARINSEAVLGIDAYLVMVEVDLSRGVPTFSTVGLPDAAVKESKNRVETAIKNSELELPLKRITVNLAPADIKKEGSGFDLPIAIGILAANGAVKPDKLEQTVIAGELSLDGTLRGIRGALPMALSCRANGLTKMIVPEENAKEAAITQDIEVYSVKSLKETVQFLNDEIDISPCRVNLDEVWESASQYTEDFSDVKGQESAKRALEVAAAGGHNLLMIGPPGSGKTMLARRLPSVLPELTLPESLETTKIHSVIGALAGKAIVAIRPFRSPHHTVSDAGLIGGGQYPRPGEVSLAHNGVLFLDELPEFNKNVLEVLRQPMEDGRVTISRAAISLTFPSRFMLVAAMNPCPCGYFGDLHHNCTCTPSVIQKYISKISGPLLDRIDIHIEVPALTYDELKERSSGEKSETIRDRVNRARTRQLERYKDRKGMYCNAQLSSKDVRKYCDIDTSCDELLKTAISKFGLSARAYDRILKVSRTIADIEDSPNIQPFHISEAIQYRTLDRKYWMV